VPSAPMRSLAMKASRRSRSTRESEHPLLQGMIVELAPELVRVCVKGGDLVCRDRQLMRTVRRPAAIFAGQAGQKCADATPPVVQELTRLAAGRPPLGMEDGGIGDGCREGDRVPPRVSPKNVCDAMLGRDWGVLRPRVVDRPRRRPTSSCSPPSITVRRLAAFAPGCYPPGVPCPAHPPRCSVGYRRRPLPARVLPAEAASPSHLRLPTCRRSSPARRGLPITSTTARRSLRACLAASGERRRLPVLG